MNLLNITLGDLPALPVFDEAGNEFNMQPFMVTHNESEEALYAIYTTETNPNENIAVKVTSINEGSDFEFTMLNNEDHAEQLSEMYDKFFDEIDKVMQLTEEDLTQL